MACGGVQALAEAPHRDVAHPVAEKAGKKKALLVGINYFGTSNELEGCINDVRNQMKALTEYCGFAEKDILLLSDDQKEDAQKMPTKANIQKGFAWLFEGAVAGDELVFHYSGHGSQVPDTSGQEGDGMNECICPVDCIGGKWPDTVILDDEIHKVFYEDLPPGVRCVCIFDCCHSGTMGDLPYTRAMVPRKPRYLPPPPPMQEALAGVRRKAAGVEAAVDSAVVAPAAGGGSWWFAGCQPVCCKAAVASPVQVKATPGQRAMPPQGAGNVDMSAKTLLVFSGCQDDQYSGDVYVDDLHQGAFSWAMFKQLAKAQWHTTYEDLLAQILNEMREQYPDQTPALSSSCSEHLKRWYLDVAP